MKTFKTILHPNDLSELSQQAFQKAFGLAQEHGARLILLHVHEPQEVVEGEFGMLPPEPEPDDDANLAELRRLLPANPPISAECMVARGVAADEIIRVAKATKSDLIVMASHGQRNFLTHWLHANVAERVSKESPCEVMIVASTPTEKEAPVFLT
jgi:nucleotide-binding universal stress UspA family protein